MFVKNLIHLVCVCFSWVFISRFPLPGLVWAPWWVPMLCVSCADQWAELSWSLWCSSLPPFFADTYSQEIDHPGEPQEACISILLIATNSHIAAVFSPTDGLLSKQRLSRGATVTMKPFPDERKHLITAANIPFLVLVANAVRTQRRKPQVSVLLTTLRAHGGRPTPLYSSVLAFSHIHADPRPSRCCRSRTPKP